MLNTRKEKILLAGLLTALGLLALEMADTKTVTKQDNFVKIGVPWEGESGLHYGDVRSDALMVHKSVPSIRGKASQIDDKLFEKQAQWNDALEGSNSQEKIANFYAEKYSMDAKQILPIIYLANQAGKEANINPLVIIAIISHESNFQPSARNKSGAEGLMQVMTNVHKQKFKMFGGTHTTFDPAVNIRVGTLILKQCIAIMKTLSGGLRYYAGAANETVDDRGFVKYIQNEQSILEEMLTHKKILSPQQKSKK